MALLKAGRRKRYENNKKHKRGGMGLSCRVGRGYIGWLSKLRKGLKMATHTTDEFFQELIADAESDLDALRQKMHIQEMYVTALREKRREVKEKEAANVRESTSRDAGKNHEKPRLPAWASGSMPEKIRGVLREARRPMRVVDITKRLEELGVKSTSSKGLMPSVVSSLLRREDLFVREGRGIYALKDGGNGKDDT